MAVGFRITRAAISRKILCVDKEDLKIWCSLYIVVWVNKKYSHHMCKKWWISHTTGTNGKACKAKITSNEIDIDIVFKFDTWRRKHDCILCFKLQVCNFTSIEPYTKNKWGGINFGELDQTALLELLSRGVGYTLWHSTVFRVLLLT